jgi:nitrite reductase/ring-hydroxylating ferredoxin subunit/uncharacterized membrane protein
MATTVEQQEQAKPSATAARETVADRIEALEALDPAADVLQRVGGAVRGASTHLENLLSGTWLGHPLHPLLTDVVIGAWTSSLVLDLVGGRRSRAAADTLVGVGVAAAVPTALAGVADSADLSGRTRRAATVHAIGNSSALAVYGLSWLARRRGRRGTGRALALLGFGLVTGSAWLGGHLSFRKGVGVNQTAFEPLPSKWTAVLDEGELEEGTLGHASAGGAGVLLVRKGRKIHALADRCSHRGCSLHEGELEEDQVICPCHGSTFRLDGSIVRGPATAPQPALEARVRTGKVEVRVPPSG